MSNLKDLSGFIGKKYSRLTIIKDIGMVNGKRMVLSLCDCGKEKIINWHSIRRGLSQSCGCLRIDTNTTHGYSKHLLRGVWSAIKSRCYKINDPSYHNYGARGVTMAKCWIDDYGAFYIWCIANGWQKGLDLDKDIKSQSGSGLIYSPEYCLFVKRKNNLRSKRNNNVIVYNGESKCMSEWAEYLGMPRRTIDDRLGKGWPIEKVLTPYKKSIND